MNIVAENTPVVNEKLRFGKIVRSPIVAWGFDTATADLSPTPLAYGGYARFGKNECNSTWHFVPAAPGSYEVSYLVDPEHWEAFDNRDIVEKKELQRSAGAMFLGVEFAGDAESRKSCLEEALSYEKDCGPGAR
jgi:hypothetical protein